MDNEFKLHMPKIHVKKALFVHGNMDKNYGCIGCPYLGMSSCTSKLCEDALFWMSQDEELKE